MGGGVTAAMASAGRLFPKSTKMLVATTRGDEETAYVAETGGRLRVAR